MRFIRVHRSAIVNIESIFQLEPISHGEFAVVSKNGSRTRVSRTYRMQFEKETGEISVVDDTRQGQIGSTLGASQ